MAQSTDTQIAIDNLQVADPEPPEPVTPSTLGQTPHEPTVRPWELELLISGALVFGLMQLPGQVDAWFQRVSPRLDGGWHLGAFMGWFYLTIALYVLVAGFVLHLLVRGYWVGVIGIEAVFPDGIRWDNVRGGPIIRQISRERTPSLQTMIDRADRLASVIFGGAIALAMMFVYSLAIALVGGVVGWAVGLVVPRGISASVVFSLLAGLYAGPVVIAGMVDRRMGDRLPPDGRGARVIRRVGEIYIRLQPSRAFTPLFLTLISNLRSRRFGIVALATVPALFVAFFFVKNVLLERGVMNVSGYTYLPENPGSLEVNPGYYADKRMGEAGEEKVPQIQSDIIREPYVRLFIPYRPQRHNELIARRCPGVRAGAPNRAAREASLRCMASLQPVTLNGKPLAAPFRFYTLPESGIRGIVAYIPTAALPRGENQLVVGVLPTVDPADKPAPPYRIPFWL